MQPKYLKIGAMSKYIGRSTDYLRNKMGTTFKDGTHYFKRDGASFWSVAAMTEFIEKGTVSDKAQSVLDAICA